MNAAKHVQDETLSPALMNCTNVQRYTDLNRTRIYQLIRNQDFPAPIKIGKSSRWKRTAIDSWIKAQGAAA